MTESFSRQRSQSIRLGQLDGVRTVAILWVALFHYAVFWAPSGEGLALLPYGDALFRIPMADVGYLGVYLFFIVSGSVISLSLERSRDALNFALLRAIRLWPTLLICGTITFLLTTALGPEPLTRSIPEFLISLTFVPPAHIGKVLGAENLQWLDGAYWSLWTEVRFYFVAAVLFFFNRQRFLRTWTGFSLVCSAMFIVGAYKGGVFDAVSRLLFAEHQPYFSAGIALAMLRRETTRSLASALLAISVLQAFFYVYLTSEIGFTPSRVIGMIFVFSLASYAMLAQRSSFVVLSSRPMVLCGYASYAYYLLHQNAGLAVLEAFSSNSGLSSIFIMLLVQCSLLGLSIFLTLRIEEPLRRALRQRVRSRK